MDLVELYQPDEVGWIPLRIEFRDAVQTACEQWAFVNRTPCLNSRSRCGVFACGCPSSAPSQSFKSSMAMNSTLGRSATGSLAAQMGWHEPRIQMMLARKSVTGKGCPLLNLLWGGIVTKPQGAVGRKRWSEFKNRHRTLSHRAISSNAEAGLRLSSSATLPNLTGAVWLCPASLLPDRLTR